MLNMESVLKSILNGMDALIAVCEQKTFKILFLNDAIRKNFGIKHDGTGHVCYELLQKRDAPCEGCPYDRISSEKTIVWEHEESVKKKTLLKNAKLIPWPNGTLAHLEYAIDVSELRKEQEENARLKKEAGKIYFDALTGICNRRFFDEEIAKMKRARDSVGLLMIDIDFFKMYNDEYGHVKGDECLRAIARTINRSLTRKTDFAARYGGEEFVVVLPGITKTGLKHIAERILSNVSGAGILHPLGGPVTVSIGASVGKDGAKILESADKMLYKSKNSGRNRVSI